MSVNEQVLETLRKVLNLAARGATQGEMEAAMARAKAIAIKHNIDLASVSMADPKAKKGVEVENDSSLQSNVAFERKFHRWVFHVISELFGVRFILSRQECGSRCRIKTIYIIGETTDVAIAKAVFPWLEDLYPKSYRKAVNDFKIAEDNSASAHGYYRGLSAGILEVNRKAEEEVAKSVDANKYALVVRDKKLAIQQRVEQDFPVLSKRKSRTRDESDIAAGVGYERGKQINLNQINSGAKATGHLN